MKKDKKTNLAYKIQKENSIKRRERKQAHIALHKKKEILACDK